MERFIAGTAIAGILLSIAFKIQYGEIYSLWLK